MATTNFETGTVIEANWLNDVDDITYRKSAETVSVKDPSFGAVGDGVTDDTAAIQAALDTGLVVYLPQCSLHYKVTKTLNIDTINRQRIVGSGMNAAIVFYPTSDSDNLFEVTNDLDNIVFENLSCRLNSSNTKRNISCYSVNNTIGKVTWFRCNIEKFNLYGIYRQEGVYDVIKETRFLNNNNAQFNDHLTIAILYSSYANTVSIKDCIFLGNDKDIIIPDGNALRIRDNSFESSGNSGNTFGFSSQVDITGVDGLSFTGNYIERPIVGASQAFLSCSGCNGVGISENMFVGIYGGTVYTNAFIYLRDQTKAVTIENNSFSDINNYFIKFYAQTGRYVKIHKNRFHNASADLTTYSAIMALMETPSLVELDIVITTTWNPPSLVDGAGVTSSDITVPGLIFGDFVSVTASSYSTSGMIVQGYVDSTGNAKIRLQNETGGTLDLADGTWVIRIFKPHGA